MFLPHSVTRQECSSPTGFTSVSFCLSLSPESFVELWGIAQSKDDDFVTNKNEAALVN
ncbi:hypothetical protein DPMN_133142 [Dreissena polymorpha]|uniref:Uncharacterized protein n=1 Tax=Dreissena polymorpha TaxID=45954 RepID=A0A9D4FTP9_DREPO|nr:hypothetical protein DPMN_133142 [Dreissena polymorpha]